MKIMNISEKKLISKIHIMNVRTTGIYDNTEIVEGYIQEAVTQILARATSNEV
jgi:hypothetical protein